MKTLASAFSDELAAEIMAGFMLLKVEFSTVLRYTDCDIPITVSGNKYTPKPIKFDIMNFSAGLGVDEIDIDISNIDRSMSAIVLSEDIKGAAVTISVVAVGSDYQPIGSPVDVWFGELTGGTLDEDNFSFTTANELARWRKKTLRICQVSCPWVFKERSDECGYAGAGGPCDQSYASCLALGNQANFGGFRFMKATQEKEWRWGTW